MPQQDPRSTCIRRSESEFWINDLQIPQITSRSIMKIPGWEPKVPVVEVIRCDSECSKCWMLSLTAQSWLLNRASGGQISRRLVHHGSKLRVLSI